MEKLQIVILVLLVINGVLTVCLGNVLGRVYRRSIESQTEPENAREAIADAGSGATWFNNAVPQFNNFHYALPLWWNFFRPMLQTMIVNSNFRQHLQQEYEREFESEAQAGKGEFELEGRFGNGETFEISSETGGTEPAEGGFENNLPEAPELPEMENPVWPQVGERQEQENLLESMAENVLEPSGEQDSGPENGFVETDSIHTGFEGDGFLDGAAEKAFGEIPENKEQESIKVEQDNLGDILKGEMPEVENLYKAPEIESSSDDNPFGEVKIPEPGEHKDGILQFEHSEGNRFEVKAKEIEPKGFDSSS